MSISLLTDILPTAYCRHLDAAAFPFVTVTIDNTGQGCANVTVRGSATVQDYSDAALMTISFAQDEQKCVSQLPLLKPAAVVQLNDIRPATLHVSVEQTSPTNRVLYDRTERIHLQARDIALLAIQASDSSIIDLTRYLSAWVTPRRPEIEQLLRKAAERHSGHHIVGYQGASTLAQGIAIVREQARAIFNSLKHDSKLVYTTHR